MPIPASETPRLHPPVELRTERLLLRGWKDSDRSPFAALNADPEVMEYFPSPLSREDSDAMVDRLSSGLQEQGWGLWATEVLETGEFIGFVGLSVPRFEAAFTPCVEVGWRLGRTAWGQGYATEAATEVLRFGLDRLALAEIVSFTSSVNRRSRAVMQRLGMSHDLADDFDHPLIDEQDPLRHHVLYRIRSGRDLSGGPDQD